MKTGIICALMALFLVGCTSVVVRPLDLSHKVEHVCIQLNTRVIVKGFLTIIEDSFDRHGISTEVFQEAPPEHCKYVLTYTALRSWDFATYLSHAEFRLLNRESSNTQIAYAEYHLKSEGGLSMMKWQSAKTKINPVLDKLLADYKRI